MRSGVDAATLALYLSGDYDTHWRLNVENGSGSFVNLDGRYTAGKLALPNPNAPIGSLDIDLIREGAGSHEITKSLAHLVESSTLNRLSDNVTYSPLLEIGRSVVLDVALTAKRGARPAAGSNLWYEMHRGPIRRVSWPGYASRAISFTAGDQASFLKLTKSEFEYTYTAGTPLETVINQILGNHGFTAGSIANALNGTNLPVISLTVPVPTGKVLSVDYKPKLQTSVWDQIAAIATSAGGWLTWFRYTGQNTLSLWLFSPLRTKTSTDMILNKVHDFREIAIDEEEIRNVGYVQYFNQNGVPSTIGPQEDQVSIERYGGVRRTFWIGLGEDSPVRSETDATALLNDALQDVSHPDILGSINTHALVFAESGVDLYHVPSTGNERFFDNPRVFAPFGIDVNFAAEVESSSNLTVRGSPSAGTRLWLGKVGTHGDIDPLEGVTITDLVPLSKEADGSLVMGWKLGPRTAMAWGAARSFPEPETEAQWTALAGEVAPIPSNTLRLPMPQEGFITLAMVAPVSASGVINEKAIRRLRLTSTAAPVWFLTEFTESPGGTSSVLSLVALDPRGIAGTPQVYQTDPGQQEAGPVPMTASGAGTWVYPFALHPQHNIVLRVEVPRTDGGEAFTLGPYTADSNKVPGQPSARVHSWDADVATVYMDNPDTDTATNWSQEVLDELGTLGPKTEVPARGTDPRFGSFTATSPSGKRFRLFSANSAGQEGDYLDFAVPPAFTAAPPILYGSVHARLVEDATLPAWERRVQVNNTPAGGTVRFVGVVGSASLVSGAAAGVDVADGSTWVFALGGEAEGQSQVEFLGESPGYEPDSDLLTLDVLGRDTVGLLSRAERLDDTATMRIVRFRVADPYPTTDIVVTYSAEGTTGITPSSPQTIPLAEITNDPATSGYVDFTVPRPSGQERKGARVVFTGSAPDRLPDSDPVEIPPVRERQVTPTPSESPTYGYLTLAALPGASFDTVEVSPKSGSGDPEPWTTVPPGSWTFDALGDWLVFTPNPAGPWVTRVALAGAKHMSAIKYRVLRAGEVVDDGVLVFDVGVRANMLSLSVSEKVNGTVTAYAHGDTDTFVGAGGMEWSIDGSAWSNLDGLGDPIFVSATFSAVIEGLARTSVDQVLRVRAINIHSVPGTHMSVIVPAIPPSVIPPQITWLSLVIVDNGDGTWTYHTEWDTAGNVNAVDHYALLYNYDNSINLQPGSIDPTLRQYDVTVAYNPSGTRRATIALHRVSDNVRLGTVLEAVA